jgi:ABC-type multidrug transport system fused ATPase/permease subunit
LDGIATINAFGQNQRFFDRFKEKLDENSSAMFMFNSAMRWQAVWLDLLVVSVSFCVSCLIVILAGQIEPSDAGMALAFALQMSGIFQFAVRSQTDLESKMTAVERVSYYYKVEIDIFYKLFFRISNKSRIWLRHKMTTKIGQLRDLSNLITSCKLKMDIFDNSTQI